MSVFRITTARFLTAAALSVGIVGIAPMAGAMSPPAPSPIGGFTTATTTTLPPVGPDDFTIGDPDPECNPMLGSCDLAPNPVDPGDPGEPGEPGEPGGSGGSDGGAEVDGAVVANPTFTG